MAKYVISPSIAYHRVVDGPRLVRFEAGRDTVGKLRRPEPLAGVINAVALSAVIWGLLAFAIF